MVAEIMHVRAELVGCLLRFSLLHFRIFYVHGKCWVCKRLLCVVVTAQLLEQLWASLDWEHWLYSCPSASFCRAKWPNNGGCIRQRALFFFFSEIWLMRHERNPVRPTSTVQVLLPGFSSWCVWKYFDNKNICMLTEWKTQTSVHFSATKMPSRQSRTLHDL